MKAGGEKNMGAKSLENKNYKGQRARGKSYLAEILYLPYKFFTNV